MRRVLAIPCKRASDPYDQMVIEIHSLPGVQQQVMSLRFEHGRNMKQIAEIMQMEEVEVTRQYHLALDSLRPALDAASKPR